MCREGSRFRGFTQVVVFMTFPPALLAAKVLFTLGFTLGGLFSIVRNFAFCSFTETRHRSSSWEIATDRMAVHAHGDDAFAVYAGCSIVVAQRYQSPYGICRVCAKKLYAKSLSGLASSCYPRACPVSSPYRSWNSASASRHALAQQSTARSANSPFPYSFSGPTITGQTPIPASAIYLSVFPIPPPVHHGNWVLPSRGANIY